MTDINLLHDRAAGDETKDAAEKKKRQAKTVELTNPPKEPQQDATTKPGGVMSFFKSLFGSRRSSDVVEPKILHQKRVAPADEAPALDEAPPKERFAPVTPPEPNGVEDIFAPPPTPSQPPRSPLERRTTSTPVSQPPRPIPPQQKPVAPVTTMGATPTATPAAPVSEPPGDDGGGGGFLGVNLVPEEMLSGSGRKNRLAALGLVVVMTAIIVALAYVGLSIFQSRIVSETEKKVQEIADLDRQIQALTTSKRAAIDFHANTQQVVNLLDSHIYWTNLLAALEQHTVQSVVIKSIAADQAGHLTLTMAGKDYRSVAQQLIAFEAATELVQSVSITAATTATSDAATGGSVDFSATIILTPAIFQRTSTGEPASGPSNTSGPAGNANVNSAPQR